MTPVELKQTIDAFGFDDAGALPIRHGRLNSYFDLGMHGGLKFKLVRSEMGSGGQGGSALRSCSSS